MFASIGLRHACPLTARPAQQCTVHSIYYEVRDRWVPMLRLRGLWLEELGLGVGSRVSIRGELASSRSR
ncbi:MAG TPA: SymE family type I addiction module toxin [Stenotrophomonas sp.]|nr:SymE family type I addiction module toxin [Stenotrophomonas sp.]